MSILISMIKDKAWNLLLNVLIFKWPTITFCGHWILISLRSILASRMSFCSVLSNEFGIDLLLVINLST